VLRQLPIGEWRALLEHHPNVLLEGSGSDLDETLIALSKDFYPQQISWATAPSFTRPVGQVTVVVREITALDVASRYELRAWLKSVREPIQVVTTSSVPLFPLVEQDAFPADLYYRINTVRLVLS
jgi:hypothetical protein